MLDPVLFAVFGTTVLGGSFKALEVYLNRDTHKVLDYDKRWSDPDYVSMIHKTRELEAGLGFDLSSCECLSHGERARPKPKPKPPKVPAVVQPQTKPKPRDPLPSSSFKYGNGYSLFRVTVQTLNEYRYKNAFLGLPILSIDYDARDPSIAYVKVRTPDTVPEQHVVQVGDGRVVATFTANNENKEILDYKKYVAQLPAKYWGE